MVSYTESWMCQIFWIQSVSLALDRVAIFYTHIRRTCGVTKRFFLFLNRLFRWTCEFSGSGHVRYSSNALTLLEAQLRSANLLHLQRQIVGYTSFIRTEIRVHTCYTTYVLYVKVFELTLPVGFAFFSSCEKRSPAIFRRVISFLLQLPFLSSRPLTRKLNWG